MAAERDDAINAAIDHAAGYVAYRSSRVGAFLGMLKEHGFTVAALAAQPSAEPGLDVREPATRVVALLLTSGKEPPPLNDYGLLSTLAFYAGSGARTAVDAEQARRFTALSEAVHDLRAALTPDRPTPGEAT